MTRVRKRSRACIDAISSCCFRTRAIISSIVALPLLRWKDFGPIQRLVAGISMLVDFIANTLLLAFVGMCANRANLVDPSHNTAWIGTWISWVAFWLLSEIITLLPLLNETFCGCQDKMSSRLSARRRKILAAKLTSFEDEAVGRI